MKEQVTYPGWWTRYTDALAAMTWLVEWRQEALTRHMPALHGENGPDSRDAT